MEKEHVEVDNERGQTRFDPLYNLIVLWNIPWSVSEVCNDTCTKYGWIKLYVFLEHSNRSH